MSRPRHRPDEMQRRQVEALAGYGVPEADISGMGRLCQAYGRWVEAEKKLKETPPLLRTPAGYVQPSPWPAISIKNVELMHKFMCELGLSPVSPPWLGPYATR